MVSGLLSQLVDATRTTISPQFLLSSSERTKVGVEVEALRHRACRNRGGSGRESPLEEPVGPAGCATRGTHHKVEVVEREVGVADETIGGVAGAKGKSVAAGGTSWSLLSCRKKVLTTKLLSELPSAVARA